MSEYEKDKTELGLKPNSVEDVDSETLYSTESIARREGVKPAFVAKVAVLSQAIAECGMGRYQWDLFITAGTSLQPVFLIGPRSDYMRPLFQVSDGLRTISGFRG